MAFSAHPLLCRPVGDLFTRRSRRNGEGPEIQSRARHRWMCPSRPCGFTLWLFGPLDGIPRTFLAARMLAIVADPVGAKSGLAMMASSMDAHPDFLLHAFCIRFDRRSPLARFQGQPIFCKQRTRPLFQNCATTSSCCGKPETAQLGGFGLRSLRFRRGRGQWFG